MQEGTYHCIDMAFRMSGKEPRLLLCLLLCVHQGLSYLTTCPDRWVAFRGSCYLFGHENPLKFVEAEHYCRQHNGHLVHIDNATEQAFLADFVHSLNQHFWIGMTDETAEGIWEWYDTQTTVKYTHWSKGSPDNYNNNEDCAVMVKDTGYWNDAPCSNTYQPLCEIRDSEQSPIVG